MSSSSSSRASHSGASVVLRSLLVGVSKFLPSMASPMKHVAVILSHASGAKLQIVSSSPSRCMCATDDDDDDSTLRARLPVYPPPFFLPLHTAAAPHTAYTDDNNIRHAPAIPSLFELTALSCSFSFRFSLPSTPSHLSTTLRRSERHVPGNARNVYKKDAIGELENVRLYILPEFFSE